MMAYVTAVSEDALIAYLTEVSDDEYFHRLPFRWPCGRV
jgi:hypothetical protein